MPVHRFDQRLNEIFELRDKIEVACMKGDKQVMNDQLAEALGYSCLLLKEINGDETIISASVGDDTWRTLQAKKKTGELEQFIATERRILGMTKLEPEVVSSIVSGLTATIEAIIEYQGRIPHEWRNVLALLAADVCGQASDSGHTNERRVLLKRAFLAAGGVFTTVLNLVPADIFNLDLSTRTLSTSTGLWMLDHAWGGFLDNLIEH